MSMRKGRMYGWKGLLIIFKLNFDCWFIISQSKLPTRPTALFYRHAQTYPYSPNARQEVIYLTDHFLTLPLSNFAEMVCLQFLNKLMNENRSLIDREVEALSIGRKEAPKITCIQPFLRAKLFQHNFAERAYHDYPGLTGLRIEYNGTIQSAYVIFHVIDAFFKRHPVTIMHLSYIQHYMFNKYCGKYPALVFSWFNHYWMIKYSKRTAKLMQILSQCEYSIPRNQIGVLQNGNSYQTVFAFQDCFRKYLKDKGVRVTRLQITQQFIYFLSDEQNHIQFWQKLQQFLLGFSLARHEVTIFKDKFEASIFMDYYVKELKDIALVQEPAKGSAKKKIVSINYLTDEETADHIIEELHCQMIKNYKLLPSLVKPPPHDKMRQVPHPHMASLSSLRLKIHLINDKFKLVIRSFGSIYQNEDIGLFLIHDLNKCTQFRGVLAESGVGEGAFMDWIRGQRGQRYLQYLADKSKYFNSAIGWYTNMITKNKDRIVRDLQYFFNTRYRETMNIKIIIPVDSKELIQFVIPIFLHKLLELTRFSEAGLVKTVEFIASINQQEKIREGLRQCIYKLSQSRCMKIQTFNPLDLSLFSIQKMVELKFLTVEYWLRGQTAQANFLSSLNSTVVIHQATKSNGIRKLIIATNANSHPSCEFILNIYMEKIFSVSPEGAIKEEQWRKMGARMRQVIQLVRKFCPNMDMLVLYGDESMQSVETCLFYCQINEGDRQASMTKMEIDLQTNKAALSKQIVYEMRFKFHNDKERYIVETHELFAEQARKILKNIAVAK